MPHRDPVSVLIRNHVVLGTWLRRTSALLSGSLLALSPGAWCGEFEAPAPEQCYSCRGTPEVTLCTRHLAEEAQVLEEQVRMLDSDREERRLDALEKISALTRSHENAPSPAVARALGDGLDDESMTVRVRATELLADGQHQGTTLEVLTAAVGPTVKLIRGQLKQIDALAAKSKKVSKQIERGKGISGDPFQMLREMKQLVGQLAEMDGVRAALAQCLATIPDDRSVAGVDKLMMPFPRRLDPRPLVRSLLELGSGPALETAIGTLKPYEKILREAENDLKKAERAKLPKPPSSWNGTKEAYREYVEQRKEKQVANAEAQRDEWEARIQSMHDALSEFAVEKGLGAPPEWNHRFHSEWRSWLRENKAKMPASLGKIDRSDEGVQSENSGA